MNKNRISYIFVSMLISMILPNLLPAQLVNTNFGQNRLQYEQHKWFRYESDNFAISFPIEMEGLAKEVIEQAEADYFQLKSKLEYQVKNKIEILLFNDYNAYLQNNIGLNNQVSNTGGSTRLHSHKILLYPYEKQVNIFEKLRKGIAQGIVNRMLYGSNLQEVVQNSVLLPLAKWFIDGMIAHSSEGWNTKYDDELREIILSGTYENFDALSKAKPELAGLSMFHFIEQAYGMGSVSNVIYLTRINRSVENGFLYVFNSNFYAISASWYDFYKERYVKDISDKKIPSKGELSLAHVKSKNTLLQELSLSSTGKYLAYVSIEKGVYKVWMHNIADNKAENIWKGGLKDLSGDIPLNYPRIVFSNNGLALYIVSQEKNQINLSTYSISEKKITQTKTIKGIDFIQEISAGEQGEILVNAVKNGQSDLFTIQVQSGQVKALTNDIFDESNAIYMEWGGQKGLVFSSSRAYYSTEKGRNKVADLQYSDLYFLANGSKEAIKLTNSFNAKNFAPSKINDNSLAYLSDESGIVNRYICQLDTVVDYRIRHIILKDGSIVEMHEDSAYLPKHPQHTIDSMYFTPIMKVTGKAISNTDYSRSLLAHEISKENSKVADLLKYDGGYKLFVRDLNLERTAAPQATQFRNILDKPKKINNKNIFAPSTNTSTTENPKLPFPKNNTTPLSNNQSNKPKTNTNPIEEKESDSPTDAWLSNKNKKTTSIDTIPKVQEVIPSEAPKDTIPKTTTKSDKIDIDNYLFGSEYENINNPIVAKDTVKPKQDPNFRRDQPQPIRPTVLIEDSIGNITQEPMRPVANKTMPTVNYSYDSKQKTPYYKLFRADALSFQFDNTPLFGGLDMYMGGPYTITPVHFGAKTNFTDVFENYRIELGIRVPLTFNGIDYYIVVEDRKGLIDKKYSFYRRTRSETYTLVDSNQNFYQEAKGRNIKHFAQAEFKYPINRYQSLRASIADQHEQVAIIAEDPISLSVPKYVQNRLWLRLEYVFDNTVEIGKNLRKGIRFKAYGDIFQPFHIRTNPSTKIDFAGAHTGAVGIDWRFYQSIQDKHVFALRASWASSFGREKILYSLGGPDNWLFPKTDELIPLPNSNGFAYQTLAAPMRGFSNNIRNGSSFFVVNAELRISLASLFDMSTGKSNFMRSLQFVPFVDIGTAWQGLTPFSKDNPLNTSVIETTGGNTFSPIRVRVNYYRQPIVMGFGAGLRAMVSGYYIKADLGFGLETSVIRKPTLQFSLGTDF